MAASSSGGDTEGGCPPGTVESSPQCGDVGPADSCEECCSTNSCPTAPNQGSEENSGNDECNAGLDSTVPGGHPPSVPHTLPVLTHRIRRDSVRSASRRSSVG